MAFELLYDIVSDNLADISLLPVDSAKHFGSCVIDNTCKLGVQRIERHIVIDSIVMQASISNLGISLVTIYLKQVLVS